MISVFNIRMMPGYPKVELDPWQVYIGRKNKFIGMDGSPLANPFDEKSHGRTACIELFRRWLEDYLVEAEMDAKRLTAATIARELRRLRQLHKKHGRLELVCWCSPLACHGDVIKEFLERKE